jgi:hypothetical protein
MTDKRSLSLSKRLQWAEETFGATAVDPQERALRFLEEALELSMCLGITPEQLQMIGARVYSRPKGDRWQEFGQVQFTLDLLGEVFGIDPKQRADIEFGRVQAIPKGEWERRHKAKVALGIAKDTTVFLCKLDKSKCDHEWNNDGCNPTHCLKCGQSFTAYAFMEAP